MKKKQRIALVITLIVALILILSFTGNLEFPLVIEGTNTISLSQATLQSSNPFLSGKVWLLTFASGGLGQSYFGSFSPSDVQSVTPDSSTTTEEFSIDVTYSDQVCEYSIINPIRTPIYNDLDRKTWTCILNPSLQDAKEKSGFSNVLWYGASGFTCFAIGGNTQSPIGYLNSPNLDISYDVKLTTPSGTATKTISPLSGSSQGSLGNSAYVSWIGNLVSGQSCDSSSPYVPAYVNGQWRLVSASAYNQYVAKITEQPPPGGTSQTTWLNDAKRYKDNSLISQYFGSIQSITSLSNAVVEVTTQKQIQFPVTTLYIKASEIGIYTPTPNFDIVATNSECFQTGNEGNIAVTIKNTGESGTGNVYAQCNSPFSSLGNIQVSLGSGQTKTIYLTMSASASQEVRGSCIVYVESPGGTKSASVNTCVKPLLTCEPNKVFCSISNNQEVVRKCSSDGATSTIIQTCSVNQYCDLEGGVPTCKDGTKPAEGFNLWEAIKGFFSNLWNSIKSFFSGVFNFTGGILNTLRNVVVLIVGIFSFLFGLDLFKKFKGIRKYKWMPWVLSLIIAGAISYFVFRLFWVGLIIFGIFILLKKIIRVTPLGKFVR